MRVELVDKKLAAEAVKGLKTIDVYKYKKVILYNVLSFVLGLFFSQGSLVGGIEPFGVAFLAAVPKRYLVSTLLGTFLGSMLFSGTLFSFTKITYILVLFIFRWAFSDLSKINSHKFYVPAIIMASTFSTDLISFIYGSHGSVSFLDVLKRAAVCAACGVVFGRVILLKDKIKGFKISQTDFLYVSLGAAFLISCLNFNNGSISSLANIVSLLLVMFCSQKLGAYAGVALSAAICGVFSLKTGALNPFFAVLLLTPFLLEIVKKQKKYVIFLSLLVFQVTLLAIFNSGDFSLTSHIYEAILCCLIFVLIPSSYHQALQDYLLPDTVPKNSGGVKNYFLGRLSEVSTALLNVSSSVSAVSDKFLGLEEKEALGLKERLKSSVCHSCNMNSFCWQVKEKETLNAVAELEDLTKQGIEVNEGSFASNFKSRCKNLNKVKEIVNLAQKEQVIESFAKQRISEAKSFIPNHFVEMGQVLDDIKYGLSTLTICDDKITQKIEDIFKNHNINAKDVCVYKNSHQNFFINAKIAGINERDLKKMKLSKAIFGVTHTKMLEKVIEESSTVLNVSYSEKTKLNLDIGASQHNCNNGRFCGDSYSYFCDNFGRMIFILCDGMGTGGRAAVESTIACQILKRIIGCGVSFKTALTIANTLLIAKSTDECLVAVDVICLNLFTGETEFVKAGAAATFYTAESGVLKVEESSLPIGIFNKIEENVQTKVFGIGERILMISDGVLYPDEKWIEEEVLAWKEESSTEFAEKIVKKAQEYRGEYDDDITAIAIKIGENI